MGGSTHENVASDVARGLRVEPPLPQPSAGPRVGIIVVRERALAPAAVRPREIFCAEAEAAGAARPITRSRARPAAAR